MFSTVRLLLKNVEVGKSELPLSEVVSMDVFIIGCGDVKWMIILSSHRMKPLAAEGLMYDPGLIECVEFDWFSVRCLEDASSFTSSRAKATPLSSLELFTKWFLSQDKHRAERLVLVGAFRAALTRRCQVYISKIVLVEHFFEMVEQTA